MNNTKVYLTGKLKYILSFKIDLEKLNSGDTSELYSQIASFFPNNNWKDIVCETCEIRKNEAECKVTIY